jgi:membrane-anchored glycerophosphoryl diester phosphodiesterase (GDPDase)
MIGMVFLGKFSIFAGANLKKKKEKKKEKRGRRRKEKKREKKKRKSIFIFQHVTDETLAFQMYPSFVYRNQRLADRSTDPTE